MNFLIEQQNKATKNLEDVTIQSRQENRVLWDKLITVILGILGFSLTIFSTEFLSTKIFTSYSKYCLLISWICYILSLIIGFCLLRLETLFQQKESLRNSLYFMDTNELLDANTLKVKENKQDQYIALQILWSRRLGWVKHWSKYANEMFEKHKGELHSYKLSNDPDRLFSFKDRMLILWSERVFYIFIFIATLLFIVSVSVLFLNNGTFKSEQTNIPMDFSTGRDTVNITDSNIRSQQKSVNNITNI